MARRTTALAANPERLTDPQLALAYSEGLGRDIHYEAMQTEEFGAIPNEAFGPGAGDSVAKDYQVFFNHPETRLAFDVDTGQMEADLRVKLMSMVDWVRKFKPFFTHLNP